MGTVFACAPRIGERQPPQHSHAPARFALFGLLSLVACGSSDSTTPPAVTPVAATGVLNIADFAAADGFIIQGDPANDSLGISVSTVGDVNSDGIDDLIIGSGGTNAEGTYTGVIYVIWGKAGVTRPNLDTSEFTTSDGFIIHGAAEDDFAGWSVADAGDINGDGIADLTVGAFGNDAGGSNAGVGYVIWGKAGATRTNIDASEFTTNDGFIIQGAAADNGLGWSVAAAGDINADGIADLVVGAIGNDVGGSAAGASYVIWGKTGATRTNIDTENFAVGDGFVIQGSSVGDGLGWSVSAAGDINNDGYDDLIVGALYRDAADTYAGTAYVIWGRAGATRANIDTAALAASDGFIISGPGKDAYLGSSVSGAGDVNNDGYDDLIIGAPYSDFDGQNPGVTFVIWGKAGATRANIDTGALTSSDGFSIRGDEKSDSLGWSVSTAGDLDNDGHDDLIVGAPYSDDGGPNIGAAYVIWGKAGATRANIDVTNLTDNDGFIIRAHVAFDSLGFSASAAGDVNNDGYDDLIVSAPVAEDSGIGDGEVYVIWGGAHLRNEALAMDPVAGSEPKRVFDAAVETANYEFDFSGLFIDGKGTKSLAYGDTESGVDNGALAGAATFDVATDVLSIDDSAINEDFDIEIIATDDDTTAIWL